MSEPPPTSCELGARYEINSQFVKRETHKLRSTLVAALIVREWTALRISVCWQRPFLAVEHEEVEQERVVPPAWHTATDGATIELCPLARDGLVPRAVSHHPLFCEFSESDLGLACHEALPNNRI